jgi:hypothetical protein
MPEASAVPTLVAPSAGTVYAIVEQMVGVPTLPELRRAISERTGVPVEAVTLDTSLAWLGLTSGHVEELLAHFQAKYQLTLLPTELAVLTARTDPTVRDLFRVLQIWQWRELMGHSTRVVDTTMGAGR